MTTGTGLMTSNAATCRRPGDPAGGSPAGSPWVVANRCDGQLVSVLVVPDPGAAFVLVMITNRFWPQLQTKVLSGPQARQLLAEDQLRRGELDGR